MEMLVIGLLLGLLAAGAAAALLRGRLARQAAELQAQQEMTRLQLDECRQRERAALAQAQQQGQQLGDIQTQLGAYVARAQRVPELERQAQERDRQLGQLQAELRRVGALLAASEEQGKMLAALQGRAQTQGEEITRLTAREQELTTLLEQERGQNAEKLELLREARESMAAQFKALAGD
ncbi:DNA recombination protein RmuC, partial [Pseudomonas sp. MWU13-2860]